MVETQNAFQNIDQAEQYVEAVRLHYRNEDAPYKGQRNNEHLQLIAEVTSDEARAIADGVMLGILALGGSTGTEQALTENAEIPLIGGQSWNDFRNAYSHLMVGFGILTHRLHNKGYKDVPSYADLNEADRLKAASVLFSDFLSHNALRFGVDTAGVPRTDRKKVYDANGGAPHYEVVTTDKDKALNERQIANNMARRGFKVDGSQHPAGKISPSEYIRLRREFSEKDKDTFDHDVSFFTDVRHIYENQE